MSRGYLIPYDEIINTRFLCFLAQVEVTRRKTIPSATATRRSENDDATRKPIEDVVRIYAVDEFELELGFAVDDQ